jgi:D-alanyl-D-alanine carboxypeptidase
MIIEKASHDSYAGQLTKRFIIPLGLSDLFYSTDFYPSAVTARMPSGYFFDNTITPLASLLGKDVRDQNLSWAQAAGGIVASLEALTRWARALYEGRVLAPTQQAELESLISEKSGQPIPTTTPDDPVGFGLGVQQVTASAVGTIWDYEGGTSGYRALHVYLPSSGAVIAVALNSAPVSTNDGIGALFRSVYATLHDAGRL